MKQTFIVDTQEDIFQFERLLRSIISLIYPDWKEYVKEWSYELDSEGLTRCPECEDHINEADYFCRWCGKKLREPQQLQVN